MTATQIKIVSRFDIDTELFFNIGYNLAVGAGREIYKESLLVKM